MSKNNLKTPTKEILENFFYLNRKIVLLNRAIECVIQNMIELKQTNETELYEIEMQIQYKLRNEIERLCRSKSNYQDIYDFNQLTFFQHEIDKASQVEYENNVSLYGVL